MQNFLPVHKVWWPEPETAKIGIHVPLTLGVYFRLVSETPNMKSIAYPSSVQKLVKVCKELWTISLYNALLKNEICTSLKFDFYFQLCWPVNTESTLLNFVLYTACCAAWSVGKPDVQSLKTAKIRIHISLKSGIYFGFVSQAIGVETTTFLSCVQNLMKIDKELWT